MEELANSYEKKYRSLKKKYKTLVVDKEGNEQQLTQAKKRVIRLQKERSFLLDRLLQYEQVSSDSESSPSSSESSEEREERPMKRVKKEERETSVRVALGPGGYRRRRVRDADEQVCIARGKDKPCKSKALQGFKYCWHHAPMDPATGFIFCQYRDANKRNAKKCNIPVHKDKPDPFCNYHVKRLQRQQNAKQDRGGGGADGAVGGGGVPEVEVEGEPEEAEVEAEGEEVEVYGGEDVFSDQDDGLDVSGSGEETSPPRFQENVVIN